MGQARGAAGGKKKSGVAGVAKGAVGSVANKLNEATGGSGPVELKFGDFFSEIFKHHTKDESEALFICGAKDTTPSLAEVSTEWPRPWLWSRVLLVLLVTTLGFVVLWEIFGNPYALPSIFFIGSVAAPLAILVFFFEANALRNISIAETIVMFFVGGVASLIITLIIGSILPGGVGAPIPSMITGLVEELGKILIVAFFMSRTHESDYILSGMLFGAAIGAGFAAFESAGYAFYWFMQEGFGTSIVVIVGRALLAIGGHAVWAAIEGGAIALVEGPEGFKWNCLVKPAFLIYAVVCVVLHGVWDMTLPVIFEIGLFGVINIKCVILIVLAWIVVGVLLNRGLAQVNEISKRTQAPTQIPGYPGQAI